MGNCLDERTSRSQRRGTIMRVLDLHTKGGAISEMRDELIRLMRDTQNEARQPMGFQQFDLNLEEWLSHHYDHRLRTVIREGSQARTQASRQNYSLWSQGCFKCVPRAIGHDAPELAHLNIENVGCRSANLNSRRRTRTPQDRGRGPALIHPVHLLDDIQNSLGILKRCRR